MQPPLTRSSILLIINAVSQLFFAMQHKCRSEEFVIVKRVLWFFYWETISFVLFYSYIDSLSEYCFSLIWLYTAGINVLRMDT